MKLAILKRPLFDGKPSTTSIDLVRAGRWALSWHRREPQTKVGLYTNWKCRCGLVACLNIPILGDFSLWASAVFRPQLYQCENCDCAIREGYSYSITADDVVLCAECCAEMGDK